MRKKLLALLMCATMVLGTAVTASAYSADDVKNAETIIKQYDSVAGELNNGAFGKYTSTPVTFATTYVPVAGDAAQTAYKWAFKSDINFTKVKVNEKNVPFKQATGGVKATMDAVTVNGVQQLVLSAADLAAVDKGTVIKTTETIPHYYYVDSAVPYGIGDTLTGIVANARVETTATAAGTGKVLTVSEILEANTTKISGTEHRNEYLIDVDGYVPVTVAKVAETPTSNEYGLFRAYTTIATNKDYVVTVEKATSTSAIAEALSQKTITKDAVAVKLGFYKMSVTDNKTYVDPITGALKATQYGFNNLNFIQASRNTESVSLQADWLTRTSLKKATGVTAYVLDEHIRSYTQYLQSVGTIFKVADVADEKFTADYLLSATYIFDVAAATDNAGKTDADATKPAADNTASPKTGDVAPIAALAVVMMGAFGAMVVASKKRA